LERYSRKRFLERTGLGIGTLAMGGSIAAARPAFAGTQTRPHLKLGWAGGTCEAATYIGHDAGFFEKEGLDVELVRLANSQAGIDALGAGKIDAIGGVIYQYLKPFEQGLDVRFAAGLHGGCLRLVAKPNCGVHKLADLKGRTVGVDAIGGGSMAFVSALLTREGVDPTADLQWRAYPRAEFPTVLDRGDVEVIAAGDPFSYFLIRDGKAYEVANNMQGGVYYTDKGISHHHFCCFAVLRGGLVRDDPKTAAALTRAWIKSSEYVGTHIEETAKIEADQKYVAVDAATAKALLSSYEWHPTAQGIHDEVLRAAIDFKQAKILDPRTDVDDLAKRAYVDIFNLGA
jgi:NitT/TauT family transport system substrate-binding protein